MLSSSCSQPSYINTGFFSYFSFMQKIAHNINDLDEKKMKPYCAGTFSFFLLLIKIGLFRL